MFLETMKMSQMASLFILAARTEFFKDDIYEVYSSINLEIQV